MLKALTQQVSSFADYEASIVGTIGKKVNESGKAIKDCNHEWQILQHTFEGIGTHSWLDLGPGEATERWSLVACPFGQQDRS